MSQWRRLITPDTAQTLLRYPDQEVQVYFEGTFVNARNAAMLEFMGRDGTLYLDRGRYELYPELTERSGGEVERIGFCDPAIRPNASLLE
jgi:hypothetical protein